MKPHQQVLNLKKLRNKLKIINKTKNEVFFSFVQPHSTTMATQKPQSAFEVKRMIDEVLTLDLGKNDAKIRELCSSFNSFLDRSTIFVAKQKAENERLKAENSRSQVQPFVASPVSEVDDLQAEIEKLKETLGLITHTHAKKVEEMGVQLAEKSKRIYELEKEVAGQAETLKDVFGKQFYHVEASEEDLDAITHAMVKEEQMKQERELADMNLACELAREPVEHVVFGGGCGGGSGYYPSSNVSHRHDAPAYDPDDDVVF